MSQQEQEKLFNPIREIECEVSNLGSVVQNELAIDPMTKENVTETKSLALELIADIREWAALVIIGHKNRQ